MRKHYHVNTFLPGCLNDDSDGPYTSRRDAECAAVWLANDYREQGWTVTGNAKKGGYWARRTPDSISGYRIAVEDCTEGECFESEY